MFSVISRPALHSSENCAIACAISSRVVSPYLGNTRGAAETVPAIRPGTLLSPWGHSFGSVDANEESTAASSAAHVRSVMDFLVRL